MQHKVEIFLDEIKLCGKTITDPQEILRTISDKIKYMGEMSFYITPKPKNKWQEWLRVLQGR